MVTEMVTDEAARELEDRERAALLAVVAGERRQHVVRGDGLGWIEELPDGCLDAVITDPPYASTGSESAWVTRKALRRMTGEEQFYEAWIREQVAAWVRKLKPTGAIWLTCDWTAAGALRRATWRLGLAPPVVGVWDRGGLGMGHLLRHVFECFAVIRMPEFRRLRTDEPDMWRHRWHPTDRRYGHAAEKPVALMRRAVRLLTKPGGLVADPFSGVGSTGIAALREGCRYIGVEREACFADVQRERILAELRRRQRGPAPARLAA